jgi:muconolactone delta-isomerase
MEARKAWDLHQAGVIRELYFRADQNKAVLILECSSVLEAQEILATLPLVQAGLISFELIPLKAYPGFARLFGER